jgi:hypothetical protein
MEEHDVFVDPEALAERKAIMDEAAERSASAAVVVKMWAAPLPAGYAWAKCSPDQAARLISWQQPSLRPGLLCDYARQAGEGAGQLVRELVEGVRP